MKTALHEEQFYLSLIKFLLHSKQGIISMSAELGLTSMQGFTLLLIDSDKPRSMNHLRKLYDCDASNITGIIDGLEQKGLVARHEHPTDRRIKVIVLEEAGLQYRAKLLQSLIESNAFLIEDLDFEEIEQFKAIIEKLSKQSIYSL